MKVVVSRTWSAVLYPMSMVNIEVILNISPEVGKAAIVEWAKNKNSLLLLKSSLWKISLFCFASRYRRRPAWVTLLTIRFCALKIVPGMPTIPFEVFTGSCGTCELPREAPAHNCNAL